MKKILAITFLIMPMLASAQQVQWCAIHLASSRVVKCFNEQKKCQDRLYGEISGTYICQAFLK